MLAFPTTVDVPLWTDEHGKIRVRDTRVLLELVIHAFQQGETAEGIVDSYPTLKLSDVYTVLGYYLTHPAAIDAYVREADKTARRIQRDVEARYSEEQRALHARLRALREANQRSAS